MNHICGKAVFHMQREEGVVAGNLQKMRNIQWRTSRTYNADALLKVSLLTPLQSFARLINALH